MQRSERDGATALVVYSDGSALEGVGVKAFDARLAIHSRVRVVSPATLERDGCVPL